jgi:hypothetical protein
MQDRMDRASEQFNEDLLSRLWFSYRSGFQPLGMSPIRHVRDEGFARCTQVHQDDMDSPLIDCKKYQRLVHDQWRFDRRGFANF